MWQLAFYYWNTHSHKFAILLYPDVGHFRNIVMLSYLLIE